MLKITAGSLKGRKVPVPPADTRPTSSKARQALFDIVGPSIVGATFLDLFAGSGIFSLEAISRGARRAIAIDYSPRSIRQIEALAARWNLPITTMLSDVIEGLRRIRTEEPFDLVYADPPYDWSGYPALLSAIGRLPALAEDAIVAIEHRSGTEPLSGISAEGLELRKTAHYGEISIAIYDVTGSHEGRLEDENDEPDPE